MMLNKKGSEDATKRLLEMIASISYYLYIIRKEVRRLVLLLQGVVMLIIPPLLKGCGIRECSISLSIGILVFYGIFNLIAARSVVALEVADWEMARVSKKERLFWTLVTYVVFGLLPTAAMAVTLVKVGLMRC